MERQEWISRNYVSWYKQWNGWRIMVWAEWNREEENGPNGMVARDDDGREKRGLEWKKWKS